MADRRADTRTWWKRWRGVIGYAAVVLVAGLGLIEADRAIDKNTELIEQLKATDQKIEDERNDRVNVQSSVNAFLCSENNEQDRVLGRLVRVSVEPQQFGEDVNPDDFTPFDLQVLQTIAKVQSLQDPPDGFEEALIDLEDTTNCKKLALLLAKANGIDPEDIVITPLNGIEQNAGGDP